MAIINDNENGQLRVQGNETIQDSKINDASKFRVGSPYEPGESGGGGGISFDIIQGVHEGNARVETVVLVGGSNGTGGELGVCVWDGTLPITDASQRKVLEMRHNEIEFKVPIKAPNLGGSGAPATDILRSQNGRVVLAAQNDGNLVLYVDGKAVRALFGLPPDQLW